jgi:hypothetical protein
MPQGCRAWHERPANLLRIVQDAGLDGFVFFGGGHAGSVYGIELEIAANFCNNSSNPHQRRWIARRGKRKKVSQASPVKGGGLFIASDIVPSHNCAPRH